MPGHVHGISFFLPQGFLDLFAPLAPSHIWVVVEIIEESLVDKDLFLQISFHLILDEFRGRVGLRMISKVGSPICVGGGKWNALGAAKDEIDSFQIPAAEKNTQFWSEGKINPCGILNRSMLLYY